MILKKNRKKELYYTVPCTVIILVNVLFYDDDCECNARLFTCTKFTDFMFSLLPINVAFMLIPEEVLVVYLIKLPSLFSA